MGKKSPTLEGHVSGQCNKPLSKPAHSLSVQEVVQELKTETWSGLDDAEANRRLGHYGNNELGEAESASVLQILIAQVANAMTLVLILAMAVSFGIRSWIEGGRYTNHLRRTRVPRKRSVGIPRKHITLRLGCIRVLQKSKSDYGT